MRASRKRNPDRHTIQRNERFRPEVTPTASVSRKTGSVNNPAQRPLCETFKEGVDALRSTLHHVDSQLRTKERNPSSGGWLGE